MGMTVRQMTKYLSEYPDDAIKVLEEYLTLGNLMEMTEDNDSVWKAGKVTRLKRREKKIWMDENERA